MFDDLNSRFAVLTLREKTLVLVSGVVLILFAGFTFIIEPQYLANKRTSLDVATKQTELQSLEQQIDLLNTALADDPNAELQQRIESLNERVSNLDREFATQMRELVPAQQMPILIEQMLAEADQLSLVELSSIAPESVFADDAENADLPLFKHGVRFVFKGRYLDLVDYLERVERFPWQIYWRSFDYQVEEYPTAVITIELFTLSTNRAFMGVQ